MDAYCSPLHRAAAILKIYSFIIEWVAKRSNYLAGNQLEVNGAAGVRARDSGAAEDAGIVTYVVPLRGTQ
jgi:hypothetical protein